MAASWRADIQCPLVLAHRSQTVQREVNTFSDPHSGGAGEEQRLGEQIITASKFLLQPPIIFRGERAGKISRTGREILRKDQPGREGVTPGCEVVEQAPESDQIKLARGIRQRRLLFKERAEPGKPVGIAAQLRELV